MTVSLRRALPEDAPAIAAIRAEPSTHAFQPLDGSSSSDLAATLAARAKPVLDAAFEGKAQWCVLADNVICGWLSLDVTSRKHRIGSIGYTVGEAWSGKGIATEAVRLISDLAFDPAGLALERLGAVAAVENLASRRVLAKAGFREEGVARGLLIVRGQRVDHMCYGLLRTDR